MDLPLQNSLFPSTCWSVLGEAAEVGTAASSRALTGLCADYWYPIYAMIRRRGYPSADACDLTQDYFLRLLDGRVIRAADRAKGRFRAFLRTDCGYFLVEVAARRGTIKRGGRATFFSLDEARAEGRFLLEPADATDAERLFDRAFALDLIKRAFARLEHDELRAGRGAWFDALRVVLIEGPGSAPYAELAHRLGSTVGAVQAAVIRLRRRCGAAVREEIAATLRDPTDAEIDEEVAALFVTLAH